MRVVIADDDSGIRAFLSILITESPELELVGSARDAAEAIDLALEQNPDVAVLDWWMPAGGGPRAAREISEACPETGIFAFSAYSGAAPSGEMLAAGASVYMLKTEGSNEDIIAAILRAASG